MPGQDGCDGQVHREVAVPAVTDTGFVPMRVSKVTALGRAVGDDVAFYRVKLLGLHPV